MEHKPTAGLYGWITHTDFASSDPEATRAWCAEVLGWAFGPSFPTGEGDYHLFSYAEQGGGGIHQATSGTPGSTPFVHVADTREAFEKALKNGAEQVVPPTRVMEGVTTAIVRAPRGHSHRPFRAVGCDALWKRAIGEACAAHRLH